MVNINFYPLDIEYKNGIRVFGQTIDNKKVCVLDESLKPYFYVIPKDSVNPFDLQKKIDTIKFDDAYVVSTDIVKKKYLTTPVVAIKVSVNHQNAINIIKDIITDFKDVLTIKETDI